jgi:NADPH2:quinone reductase
MKAAFFETTGTPDAIRFGDLPTPEPKAGEVRVKVLAASINPIDTYVRSGAAPMPLPKPAITGTDFAGVVDAVGEGATRLKVGQRVWGSNQGLLGRQGTCAEFLCVGEKWAYPTPDGVSDEHAAAGALVGITAHLGLFQRAYLAQGDGERVFVNGGTGGVGSMVVQMAKAAGAQVICTVGSEEKAKLARELGADVVVNYKTDDVPAKVKEATGGAGVTVWYETLPPGDLDKTVELMAPNGRIVVMAGRQARPALPNGPFYVKGLSLLGFAMFNFPAADQQDCAEDMNRWMAEGKLKPLIGARFPLARTAEAHRLQEDNTLKKAGTLTGKIVILPGA